MTPKIIITAVTAAIITSCATPHGEYVQTGKTPPEVDTISFHSGRGVNQVNLRQGGHGQTYPYKKAGNGIEFTHLNGERITIRENPDGTILFMGKTFHKNPSPPCP